MRNQFSLNVGPYPSPRIIFIKYWYLEIKVDTLATLFFQNQIMVHVPKTQFYHKGECFILCIYWHLLHICIEFVNLIFLTPTLVTDLPFIDSTSPLYGLEMSPQSLHYILTSIVSYFETDKTHLNQTDWTDYNESLDMYINSCICTCIYAKLILQNRIENSFKLQITLWHAASYALNNLSSLEFRK